MALYESCGCEGACTSAKEQECVKMRCQVGLSWRGRAGGERKMVCLPHRQEAIERNYALPGGVGPSI